MNFKLMNLHAFRATQWSSSQKPSPCSKIRLARFIGRAWLRVRHNMLHIIWWISNFSKYDWERMRFPHAQPRERLSSARQSFLLITEMIFDFLIAIVSLKARYVGSYKKKRARLAAVCLIVAFSAFYCGLQNCANNSCGYMFLLVFFSL